MFDYRVTQYCLGTFPVVYGSVLYTGVLYYMKDRSMHTEEGNGASMGCSWAAVRNTWADHSSLRREAQSPRVHAILRLVSVMRRWLEYPEDCEVE